MIRFSDKAKREDSKPTAPAAQPAAIDTPTDPVAKVEEPASVTQEPKK